MRPQLRTCALLRFIREAANVLLPLAQPKPTVEIGDKVRLNLEKFVWSSREK
jgi:hypothetical protein